MALATPVFAQDKDGEDHPLLPRYAGAAIVGYRASSLDEIVAKIREIVEHDSDEDGYMPLSQIGVMLSRIYADFDSRNYGFSKLHKLIDYTKAFETKYEQFDNGGKNLVIRNKG